MQRHHSIVFVALLAIVLLMLPSCRATDAGKLDAPDVWPMAKLLTERLDAYVDAGILPSGEPMGEATQQVHRSSNRILRNVFHAAMGRPLEALPQPPVEPGTVQQ